jgi:hypothetical protein
MTTGRAVGIGIVLGGLACAGCVDRRFVIESNVPNAQVLIDNRPIGAAPAHTPFEYYGYHTVTLIHPGYETLTRRVHVTAPWYAYPPFDFFAEVLYPGHIRDTRRYYFELYEATKTRTDDLLNAADALRMRGMNLPAPERPALPRSQPAPSPQPVPPPGPAPVVPPVGPGGVIPGVGPGQ